MNTKTDNSQAAVGIGSTALLGPLDACKLAVSEELMSALNGSDKTARTEEGFIRWGLVELRIHNIIEGYWPNAPYQPHGGSNDTPPDQPTK